MMRSILLCALILLFLLFAATIYYDTNTIEIRHYQISHSSLGRVLAGIKVAHLSDLHIKTIGVRETKILGILKEEKPDLILVTGDLIHFKSSYESALTFFRQLDVPLGIYAVLGNTEYSNENGSCNLCHEKRTSRLKNNSYPILLRNSLVPLKINGKSVDLIGVDDPVTKRNNLKRASGRKELHRPSILLAHSPEIFEEASRTGIDLLLCGHTHGGQVFVLNYFKNLFPLSDPTLEFPNGFFKKGKTLMYVNRGVGTSFLPFRWGVKPEITFFEFSTIEMNPDHSMNPAISNIPPETVFIGFHLTSVINTFNLFNVFNHLGLIDSKPPVPSGHPGPLKKIFFDFESDDDLERLNWECHKWFERSPEHVTSGKYSLKAILPTGQYPGIHFSGVAGDWSKANDFKMDVFNPSDERVPFHIRIDDHKSGWEYANRFDTHFELKPGPNSLTLPTSSIRTNIHPHPLNLKKIERLMAFIPNNSKTREIYIDHLRLE